MNPHCSAGTRSLLTVLYIGKPGGLNQEQLRHEGIGVVAVESARRGLRLLRNFRVAAVICDVPELASVASLVATHTPVILLAGEAIDWGGPEVTVVSRRTPAATLAAMVRQLAAATGAGAKRDAA
jgi:hypothetical protein